MPLRPSLAEIWVYLAQEPLAALTATLLAWLGALRLQRMANRHPLANPVLFAVALLAAGLLLSGIDYRAYFAGAQFVHFLLGPATVALAVPLYRQWRTVRHSLPAVLISVGAAACSRPSPASRSRSCSAPRLPSRPRSRPNP